MTRSFPPVVGPRPKILILGSMPGLESLRRRQYYAHPQNQFWRLLEKAIGVKLAATPYRSRLAALKRKGIALWDVLKSCAREGSLDSNIRDEEPNRIAELLRKTGIRVIFLNGGKSYSSFRALVAESLPAGAEWHKLPSSSPAAAGLTFDEKLDRWEIIGRYL